MNINYAGTQMYYLLCRVPILLYYQINLLCPIMHKLKYVSDVLEKLIFGNMSNVNVEI